MKIMVIDGNSIINRAFYGVRMLTNHEGLPTNAIYGFLSTLFRLQDEQNQTVSLFVLMSRQKHFVMKNLTHIKRPEKECQMNWQHSCLY